MAISLAGQYLASDRAFKIRLTMIGRMSKGELTNHGKAQSGRKTEIGSHKSRINQEIGKQMSAKPPSDGEVRREKQVRILPVVNGRLASAGEHLNGNLVKTFLAVNARLVKIGKQIRPEKTVTGEPLKEKVKTNGKVVRMNLIANGESGRKRAGSPTNAICKRGSKVGNQVKIRKTAKAKNVCRAICSNIKTRCRAPNSSRSVTWHI